tara:strand:+ start:273 stop:593 length:321 start_codon:yes stop_codon:yes gene_type:complete
MNIDLPDDILEIIWGLVRLQLHKGLKERMFKNIHHELLISSHCFDEEDVDLVVHQTGAHRKYVQNTLFAVNGDIFEAIKSIYDEYDLWDRYNPIYPNPFITVRFGL